MGPDTADTLELHSLPDGGVLNGPLAPLFRGSSSDGLEKEAAFVEAARLWRFNGQPVLSMDHVTTWCVMQITTRLDAAPAELARTFKLLRQLAVRVAAHDLLGHLRMVQGALRTRDMAVDLTAGDRDAIAWLSEWERRRLAGPFD
jgi:hypothetical protein